MKKKHLLIIATWLMLLTVSMSMLAFVGCGDDKTVLHVDAEMVGTYYVDDGDVENTLTLNVDSFTIVFGGVTQTGEYSSFDNSSANNVKVGLKTKTGNTCELAYSRGVVVLNYNGNSYRMLKKVDYTVTFDTDGGSSVVAQTVQNGRKATKPAEDPQKAGCVFLGWYKDDAYTQKYDFENTAVVSSITLYARFIEVNPNAKTYTVNFDLGEYEGELPSMQTINQKLYNLPEPQVTGAEFVGWWMSDYNDANKLSRKYEEQTINDSITLYAVWASGYPAVSVNENGAEWTVNGEAKKFTVTIKDSNGTPLKTETGEKTSYSFNFSNEEEGGYTVEVTCNGKTTVAYYLNKPLNKVNEFTVEGNVLKFEGVEGAEKYLLTLVCGNATHEHIDFDLGNATQYDFSACEMKDGKLTFVVKAVAEGHATSVSNEYVLNRTLDEVTGLTVEANTETVKWNAVANAEAYYVELTSGQTKFEKTLTETQFTMGEYAAGTWTIKVKATNKLYNSPESTTYEYDKVKLASPTQISARLNVLTWNAIEGATGYTVEIDGQEYTTTTNSLTVSEDVYNKGSFSVKVKALGATEEQNSLYSNPLNVLGELTEVNYANGFATWSPVIGATKYGVSADGGDETYVDDGNCELEYAFNSAGAHTLKVSAYSQNGEFLDDMTLELNLLAVIFNTDGGTKVDTLYKVAGDTVTLPEAPARTGYEFVGWYDKSSGGNKYEGEFTIGESGLTVFAAWNGKTYQVTLVIGDGGTMEGENVFTVTYGEEFQLPVATCNDVKKAFGGWFSSATKGVSYTDNGGNGRFAWNLAKDTTLYAQWETTGLVYTLNTDGESYLVTSGEGINYLTSVTVLATYNGKPVSQILSNAFKGCTSLEKISIPSSIQNIFIYVGGDEESSSPNADGSAFYGCSSLKEIEVYDVDGEKFYTSVDGCLYTLKNEQLDRLEYVPKAKEVKGTFEIPDGTKTIPRYALSSRTDLTEIVIPSSVTYVGDNAFSSCYNLKTVKFLPTEDGTLGEALTVKAAFKYSQVLETVIFPKRLVDLDLDAFYVFSGYETLKTITVEELGTTKDTSLNYYDLNGMLCKGDTLVYCPKGYKGEFRVPTGITKIGDKAFNKCVELTFIAIPGYVESIGESAFEGCTKVQRVLFDQSEENVDLSIGKKAFYGLELIEEVILPPALVYLGENAFGNTAMLESVTMKMTREFTFEKDVFKGTGSTAQSYVRSLTIGANVKEFNITSVCGTGLTKINVDPDNEYFLSEDDVLYDKQQTKILFVPENIVEYTIPSTIKEIGASMFAGKPFTSITIGKGVEVIGESAFEGCEELTSIIFEQGGEKKITIGKNAFRGCKNVTTLVLPERTETGSIIGESAFGSASIGSGSKVTTITVPEGFTSIGRFAFRGANSLVTLNLPASIETLGIYEDGDRYLNSTGESKMVLKNPGVNIVNGCYYLETINVAEGCVNYASKDGALYVKDAKTGELTSLQVVPGKVKGIKNAEGEDGYFEVPATVNTVCDYAFYYIQTLTEIVFLGEHETFSIGANAFYNCSTMTKPYTGLKKIQLPSGIDVLPSKIFASCAALEEIIIPNTVESIEMDAFNGCTSLKKIIFAEGGEKELTIGDGSSSSTSGPSSYTGVFKGCNNLEEVVFTDRLTSLGIQAFYECKELKRVVLPTSIATIGNKAFYSCAKLSSVEFIDAGEKAAKEMTIGEYAFSGCKELTSITLPDNLVEIKNSAFNGAAFTELSIPANVKTLGSYCLGSKTTLTKITFETKNVDGVQKSALTTLAGSLFMNCSLLESVDLSATEITELPSQLFKGCSSLKSVTFSLNVNTIGASAFSGCTAFTEIEFPKDADEKSNVLNIGNQAFEKSGLTKFEFPETNGTLVLGNKLFDGCENLVYLYISNSVNLDELGPAIVGATAISTFDVAEGSDLVFDSTNKLMLSVIDAQAQDKTYKIIKAYDKVPTVNGTFTIPSNVVEINANAFANTYYLKSVVIPSSVKTIGESAFYNCYTLESVTFEDTVDNPATLESIGNQAFYGTYSLAEITIPNSVLAIGDSAFAYSSLRKVTMPNVLTEAGKTIFSTCNSLEEVNNISKITASATHTAERMFDSCISLKKVTFANGFDTLTRGMFYKSGLETVDLTGVTKYSTVGSDLYGIFELCDSLKSVVIDENLKSLDYKMFNKCYNLETITVSGNEVVEGFADLSNITLITKESTSTYPLFMGVALRTVDIRSLTSKTAFLFYGAEKLEKVIISAGTTSLGNSMFKNCYNLKTVTYPTVNGYGGEDGCVTLPEGITFMGKNTFEGTGIEKVVIPSSTKMLGNTATAAAASTDISLFKNCTSLTTVTLHDAMTKFSKSVFEGCINLTTVNYRNSTSGVITGDDNVVTLPKTITQFGQNMFKGCTSITAVTTESSAKLDNSMFENCTSLTTASFKATQFGNLVFAGCTNLQSTEESPLPTSNVTTVGSQVFQNCTSIEYIDMSKVSSFGTTGGSSGGFFFGCTNLKTVLLKSTLTTIPKGMFGYCTSLEEITLPTSLTLINQYAFYYSGLKSITIPSKVTRLGPTSATGTVSVTTNGYVFAGCENLETVTLHDKFLYIGGHVFDGCTNLKEVKNAGKVTLIGQYAFQNAGLTEDGLTIDLSSVQTLGGYAFANSGLKEADLSSLKNGTDYFKTYAFNNAKKLTTVTLSDAVEDIPNHAFSGCSALTTVTMKSVTTIGDGAFENCTSLNNLDLSSVTTIGDSAFIGCSSLDTVTFGVLETIKFQGFLNCGFTTFTIPATLTTLGQNVFNGRYKIAVETGCEEFRLDGNGYLLDSDNTVLWIPATDAEGNAVTEITFADGYKLSGYILNGYASVTKVTLPSDLETIPTDTFWNFQGSFGEDFTLPATLTTIDSYAFQNTKGLKNVTIPSSVTTLGKYAFSESSVEIVTFEQGVKTTGSYTFYNCQNLTAVTLPGSLETIEASAFRSCKALTKVIVSVTTEELTSDGLTIGNYAFYETGLEGELSVPYGVTEIGRYAFTYTKLTKVTLPNTLTKIDGYAFAFMDNLTEINVPYTVESIGDSTFALDPKLTTVTFDETPEGTKEATLTLAAGGSTTSLTLSGYIYKVEELNSMLKGLFVGDFALKTVKLPSRLTTIPGYMFAYSGLESITLHDGIASIGPNAFMHTNITEITIPYTVTSIGANAFALCEKLTTVNFAETPEGTEEVALTITNGSYSATNHNITYNTYCAGSGKYYSGVFAGCTAIESITLPARLTQIPNNMFVSMPSIKTVVLSEGLPKLGDYAFQYATQIKELVLPASLTTYGGSTPFTGWTKDQTIIIRLSSESIISLPATFFNGNKANIKIELVD